jgi:hypothetical protein
MAVMRTDDLRPVSRAAFHRRFVDCGTPWCLMAVLTLFSDVFLHTLAASDP